MNKRVGLFEGSDEPSVAARTAMNESENQRNVSKIKSMEEMRPRAIAEAPDIIGGPAALQGTVDMNALRSALPPPPTMVSSGYDLLATVRLDKLLVEAFPDVNLFSKLVTATEEAQKWASSLSH